MASAICQHFAATHSTALHMGPSLRLDDYVCVLACKGPPLAQITTADIAQGAEWWPLRLGLRIFKWAGSCTLCLLAVE